MIKPTIGFIVLLLLVSGSTGTAAALDPAATVSPASPLLARPGLDWRTPIAQRQTGLASQDLGGSGWGVPDGRRSVYKAAALSALLPGLGQHYAGHKGRAFLFGLAEGAIWGSYITFKVQEHVRGDRAVEFAVFAAGASPNGDNDYYGAVGQFMRNDGPGMWNEFVRRRLRDTGEVVGVEYFGEFAWAWPSRDQFESYRSLRRRELNAKDDARNMIAVAIINRVASVVDVVLATRGDQHKQEERFGLKLELGKTSSEPLASLAWRNRF